MMQVIPGAFRKTNNPLLLKAEIGKPLTRGFTIPTSEFTYGKTTQNNFGNADAFSWNTKRLKHLTHQPTFQRNFITLNKAATQSGLVTAQEQSQYRATHDFLADTRKVEYQGKQNQLSTPNKVYGVSTRRPCTPVFDLLEHRYQDKWIQEHNKFDASKLTQENDRTGDTRNYSETRASRLRRYSPPVDPPPLWQMSKFKNKALPALETFRSEKARNKAFRHHSTDCTARTGVFGHGIYEGAKS